MRRNYPKLKDGCISAGEYIAQQHDIDQKRSLETEKKQQKQEKALESKQIRLDAALLAKKTVVQDIEENKFDFTKSKKEVLDVVAEMFFKKGQNKTNKIKTKAKTVEFLQEIINELGGLSKFGISIKNKINEQQLAQEQEREDEDTIVQMSNNVNVTTALNTASHTSNNSS